MHSSNEHSSSCITRGLRNHKIGQCCPKTFQPLSNNICTKFSNIHRWWRIGSDMESQSSQPNDTPENRDAGGHLSASFSCHPCRSRKLKCDRVQPRCGRCTRLRDNCEYPKERRANVGRQKRVRELETKVGQLQWLSDMGRRDQLLFTLPNELPLPPFCVLSELKFHTADQLERLARAGKSTPAAEESQTRQQWPQGTEDFMFTNELYTTPSSGATLSQDQSHPNTPFTDLVSVGLFEQLPAPELVLFLYGFSLVYHS